MRTFKPTFVLRLLVGIFLLLPAVILVGVAAFNADARPVTLAIGLPFGAIGAFLWVLAGRPLLTVDAVGVKKRGAFGGEVTLRFDEVVEYRYSAIPVHGTEQVQLALCAADGRKVKVSSNWREIYDLAQLLVEGVEAVLREPGFGPITLESDAVVYKDKRVPFAEISGVTLDGARLRVARKNKMLAAFAVGSAKVPNVFLLLDELRARGVGAPDARPWRAVVSLAGYQLPKR